jgi:hypothetical protein
VIIRTFTQHQRVWQRMWAVQCNFSEIVCRCGSSVRYQNDTAVINNLG